MGALEFAHLDTFAQNDDAAGESHDLGEFGGDDKEGDPLTGEFIKKAMDFGLGADIDAAGGFIDDEEIALAREPLGEGDFLLVAAAETGDGSIEAGGFDAELLDVLGSEGALTGFLNEAYAGDKGERGEGAVFAAVHGENEALAFAVLGDVADAMAQSAADVSRVERLVAEENGPGGVVIQTEDGLGDFAAASADQAGEAENLTLSEGEMDILKFARGGEIFDAKDFFAEFALDVARGGRLDVAADHLMDDAFGRGLRGWLGGDVAAVAENGDALAEAEDFLHPMGDVDDGDAAGFEALD